VRRVRITLGYDGTAFHGSQAQPGVRTVQAELDCALRQLGAGAAPTIFAGRTDRGVHAHGQVVSTDVRWSRDCAALRQGLDAVTAPDLVVRKVQDAPHDFHARFDACWREYRYRIRISDDAPVAEARFVWWRRSELDDDAIGRACRVLLGTHSFGAFASHGWSRKHDQRSLQRTVRLCEWRRNDDWSDGERVVTCELRIAATGFLPQMVRNISAALVEIGSGRQPATWMNELLTMGDRSRLGDAAPAHGLTLWRVEYGGDDSVKGSDAHGKYEED
jgi:tRNA pseudouridine38-40 synthase